MRCLSVLFICLLFAGCAPTPRQPDPLAASDLNNQPLIGALGLPLGTCATIRATIVSGTVLQLKEHAGRYLLRVWEVDGYVLKSSVICEFELAPGASAKLASEPFDLYELKRGKRVEGLGAAELAKLEKDYVGRQVKLIVYETGAFQGIPKNLPDDAMVWQDHPLRFETWLMIVLDHTESR